MKLLLTSAGIRNDTIATSLEKLTGKPRNESKIGFIPTAANREEGNKDWFIRQLTDLHDHGFTWIDIIDFSASNIHWQDRLVACDVIYLSGGNTFHLLNETRMHGFDTWIHEHIEDKVFVGSSAGSILFAPTITIASVGPADTNYPEIANLTALHIVDFEISPHTPEHVSYESNETYAKSIKNKLYALDDESALEVTDEQVRVVTEGEVRIFP